MSHFKDMPQSIAIFLTFHVGYFLSVSGSTVKVPPYNGENSAIKISSRCYDCHYTLPSSAASYAKLTGSTSSAHLVGYQRCALQSTTDTVLVDKSDCQTGRCFVRQDPNGIIYRGCADPNNLPVDVDPNIQCRHQGDLDWRSLWWFCEGSLCNSKQIGQDEFTCGGPYLKAPKSKKKSPPVPSSAVAYGKGKQKELGGKSSTVYDSQGNGQMPDSFINYNGNQEQVPNNYYGNQESNAQQSHGEQVYYGEQANGAQQSASSNYGGSQEHFQGGVETQGQPQAPLSYGNENNGIWQHNPHQYQQQPMNSNYYLSPENSQHVINYYGEPSNTQLPHERLHHAQAGSQQDINNAGVINNVSENNNVAVGSDVNQLFYGAYSEAPFQTSYDAVSDVNNVNEHSYNNNNLGGSEENNYSPVIHGNGQQGNKNYYYHEQNDLMTTNHASNPCDGTCWDNPSGLYPDPSRPDHFIQCGAGNERSGLTCYCCQPYYLSCPLNTVFDDIVKVCVPPIEFSHHHGNWR